MTPRAASCAARFLAVRVIEDGIRQELSRCLPTDELHEAYRAELWEAVARARRPETLNENAIRRLDAQLERVRRLYELGEYDEETFLLKRSEIRAERERLREQATAVHGHDDTEWCRGQLFDVLAAWHAADGAQRTKLLAGLFERIEAHADPATGGAKVVAVPREGWRRFFEYVVLERETGFDPAIRAFGEPATMSPRNSNAPSVAISKQSSGRPGGTSSDTNRNDGSP